MNKLKNIPLAPLEPITPRQSRAALQGAIRAARAAGALMRRNAHATKRINSSTQHDIKLELDVRCQQLITRMLQHSLPAAAILGEEGNAGNPESPLRWVVDPIDGTVNFAYGIPHCCVSIALQQRRQSDGDFVTVAGVVYDPFCGELWTAVRGEPARLNGRVISCSAKTALRECIISVGFAKQKSSMDLMLPAMNRLVRRVRKIRIMGSAALSLTYVASGRFDAYLETGLRLWDIAAGGLIIECAGGEFWNEPLATPYAYRIIANNGLLRKKLQAATKR